MSAHAALQPLLAAAAEAQGKVESLTVVMPLVVLLAIVVLIAAVLCFALGTARGSWRVWLVGYALAVAALVLAYGGVLREQRDARTAPPAPPASVTGAAPATSPDRPHLTEPQR